MKQHKHNWARRVGWTGNPVWVCPDCEKHGGYAGFGYPPPPPDPYDIGKAFDKYGRDLDELEGRLGLAVVVEKDDKKPWWRIF